MNKVEIKRGQNQLIFEGVTNLKELKEFAEEKASNYKNIVVTEENVTECKKVLQEVKPYRTQIKKYRAALNKELKSRVSEKLEEVDNITGIFDDVINPVQSKIDEYTEQKRVERLERKKTKFQPEIDKINEKLSQADALFVEVEYLEFDEDWANKKESDIVEILNQFVVDQENKLAFYKARIETVETECKLLKNEYDLAGEINWEILGARLYDEDYKKLLDGIAANQQEQELAAQERAEQEAERKAQAERDRLEAEQKQKERAAEQERLRELEAAQEKARAEERARIEKERLEEEARKREIEENDRKLRDQEIAKRIEKQKKIEEENKKKGIVSRTLHFPELTKDQGKMMIKFFNENKIKYEVM